MTGHRRGAVMTSTTVIEWPLPDDRQVVYDREPQRWDQVQQAYWMLVNRPHMPDIVSRAATVLLAEPQAPLIERCMGGKANTSLNGHEVRCRACHRSWTADEIDPVLNATTRRNGICAACFAMTETRPEAATAVLEGVVVPAKPSRRRKADPADETPAEQTLEQTEILPADES